MYQPGPPVRPGAPYPPVAPPKPPVRVWDIVVTVILLVGLGFLAMTASFYGLFLGMVSDGCGSGSNCNFDIIGMGVIVAVVLPWVVLLAAVIVAIIRLVRRKLAFWIPLAAAPLIVGPWFLGAWIATAGLPS